ncbi:glycoside hydrolase N-terminal domain-containing protein [Paenibacillus chondroitinus]|uniref:Glycoside hydrolase N-terminal domain-containing protein n=1 Tax=Paenibacillus chondroitinus TaxID=59842 RepID=A0ABU6DAD2_9BACL|nr:glycoside hydrolase N-terminal domain-containing protein [Paenibacillus chondroitinus]MCY9661796.1 glycoside hydrolase N-terminal domain-containing protein [Paenibacillus anseongense]MEB4793881.1 glycoside hydrolase N-terminal domain-containing protein [Paenibacillus chondroitinus]
MRGVTFENAPSSWNEALPIGNGHFGGMVYFEDNKLTLALNHYEVYYQKLHRYSKKYRNGEGPDFTLQHGRTFDELKKLADERYRDPEQGPFYLYGDALSPNSMYRKYGKASGGASHYPTGELHLFPSKELSDPDHYSLSLDIEKAVVQLNVVKNEDKLGVRTIIAQDGDYVITTVSQTNGALLPSVALTVPRRRYVDMQVTYHQLDDTTLYYMGAFYPDGEEKDCYGPFSFIVMVRIIGAKGIVVAGPDDSLQIALRDAEANLTLLTTVVTEEETEELLSTALMRLTKPASHVDVEDMVEHHQAHWRSFWSRSSITLPDKMMEDLWYINLYAIACSSGKGGRMREQACGLNGLWDIKQPTKWGSMWYWDVNIQAAFWPLYTANRLEVAEAFNEGLLSYVQLAERMSQQFYGLEGIAGDYPHALYVSIWPWCAQFLWDYYRYSMDIDFLREKAYPLFERIARFFEGYLQLNESSGCYEIFPDISPEQGPLTRNSTCSLAAVKYLLKIASDAGELLGEAEEDRLRWRTLADSLAEYPTAVSKSYGDVFLDSEWAPADMHLRHPSLLMPVYPIGEIDKNSETHLRKRGENTLRYAAKQTEYGMFQFGWLSCAASRLGKGNTALRLLYEQGIDLSLRCNGLFAEETERWMNYCNITNEPLYHPHMMEASGEMVAAVNEMLLQSYDGVIDVFPALPDGELEPELSLGLYEHEVDWKVKKYEKWSDCSFRGLLAVGAFEVSAELKNGRTAWVTIQSKAGERVVIRNPFHISDEVLVARKKGQFWNRVDHVDEDGRISFETEKNVEYAIYPRGEFSTPELFGVDSDGRAGERDYPLVHEAHTHRRVFLGKNHDTQHARLLDHFTFDYYSGNTRESRLAAYRLDFGVASHLVEKDYTDVLPRQVHVDGVLGQTFRKVTLDSMFKPYTGIGWECAEDLGAMDRGGPDELRRDFIGGKREATFVVELPKGRYDLLFVSGDQEEPSYTEIEIVGGTTTWKPEKMLKAGEFATDIVPIAQRGDGYLKLRLRTCEGSQWRMNALIINKNYTYL